MAKISIIYYSATGNTFQLAKAVAEGAEAIGAEVRLRKVPETATAEAIAANPAWQAHVLEAQHIPLATLNDIEWADGFVFGSPTRFGLPAGQLKLFIDSLGSLWAQGKLQDKAAGVFGGAGNIHGGQEASLLALQNVFYHWGSIIVPVGYTNTILYKAGGNPYGVSFTHVHGETQPEDILAAAHYQGERIAKFAGVLAETRAKEAMTEN